MTFSSRRERDFTFQDAVGRLPSHNIDRAFHSSSPRSAAFIRLPLGQHPTGRACGPWPDERREQEKEKNSMTCNQTLVPYQRRARRHRVRPRLRAPLRGTQALVKHPDGHHQHACCGGGTEWSLLALRAGGEPVPCGCPTTAAGGGDPPPPSPPHPPPNSTPPTPVHTSDAPSGMGLPLQADTQRERPVNGPAGGRRLA